MTVTSANPSEVTIVTACRNRRENLSTVLPSWLKVEVAKILICDWGSSELLTLESLGISDKYSAKIEIIRVSPDTARTWILTWAFNEVLAKVETPYVLKLDCDHKITAKFLFENPIESWMFVRGHWRNAGKGQEYINGAFFSCVKLLNMVGFYDERITTYGWDDSDLYARLYDACAKSAIIAKGSIFHVKQDEEERTSNQRVARESILADVLGIRTTEFLISRNRILCGLLWPWSRLDYINRRSIRAKFYNLEPDQIALNEYATLKAFSLHYAWKSLELINNLTPCEAYSRALFASGGDRSCLPLATGVAQMLKMYSDAEKVGDDNLKGIIRHLLAAKDLPEYLIKSRMKSLDAIDRLHSDNM